jgi:hypothetical protein
MAYAMQQRWYMHTADSRQSLVQVTLTDPSPITLYVSGRPVINDGTNYDPVVTDCVVTSPGAWLTADVSPASMRVTLLNVPLSSLAGARLSNLLVTHRMVGATVELWLSADGLSVTTSGYRRFRGVVQTWELTNGKLVLHCLQRRDYNKPVAPLVITRGKYPGAPDNSIGATVPIIYGDFSSLPLRVPYATKYPVSHSIREFISGGDRVAHGILVDTGRQSNAALTPAKVLVASHQVKQLGILNALTGPFGTAFFLKSTQDDALHVVDPEPANIFNAADGAGFNLPDGQGWAYAPVFPSEIRLAANFAEDPRNILDRRNEGRYAKLDYAASKRFLYAKLEAKPNLGRMTNAYAYILYFSSAVLTSARFQFAQFGVGATAITLVASTTPTWDVIDLGGNNGWGTGMLPAEPWDFSSRDLQVDFSGGGTPAGQVYVIAMGVVVEYEPTQEVLESVRTVSTIETRPLNTRRDIPGARGRTIAFPYEKVETIPPVTELRGSFYANVLGYADDGSGTNTGVAAALIERPPDIARHILTTYAGESPAAICTSGLGDFNGVRQELRTWHQKDMKLALSIGDQVDVTTALSWIASGGLSWCYLCEVEDVWRFIPWRRGRADTYGRTLNLDDILDPVDGLRVESLEDSTVASGVRIPYAWDVESKNYMAETNVSTARSSAGHWYYNIRDQDLLVRAGENDKLDVRSSAGVITTVTLTAGASGYDGVLSALKSVLTPIPGTRLHGVGWSCAWGGYVHASAFNRFMADNTSAVLVQVTLPPGFYQTLEEQAAATQTELRNQTGDSRWFVTYSRATRKFTFGKTGVNCQVQFNMTSPTEVLSNNAAASFGYKPLSYSGATSHVADYAVEEQLLLITNSGAASTFPGIAFLWETGTNGLKGATGLKCAAELLGFDQNHDSASANSHQALCPKFNREQILALTASRYGTKRETTIEGRAIQDSETAMELRNRVADLTGDTPPLVIRFMSGTLADLRRGDVFTTSGEWDTMMVYPRAGDDGSWEGKRFVAVELVQHAIPDTHTEVLAVAI